MLSGKPVWTWPSVIAVDAGPMQIQLGEGRVWRCAEAVLQCTIRDTSCQRNWLRCKSVAKTIVVGAGRKDRFGGEPERYGACLGTQSFCVGESGFMQQIRSNAETGELPGPR